MSNEIAASSEAMETLILEVPRTTVAEIDAAAAKYGLSRSSYFLMLHALRRGSVRPSLPAEVREIFTHDREILRELAK
jgi:hypothetical protein